MGKSAQCHWYPTSIGRLTDDGYKRGIAEDLRAGKIVKRHTHYYREGGIDKNECDCPVDDPTIPVEAEPQDEGSGVGSSPSSGSEAA